VGKEEHMRWKIALGSVLVMVVALSACASDPTASDEYLALEEKLVTTEQQLSDTAANLAEALASLDEATVESGATMEIPAEVVALIDEWWAANDRGDGSVVDLYMPSGYHLYGDEKIALDDLASHLNAPGYTAEWITEPYLMAAEPEGRYVVTRGVRTGYGGMSWATALTFEILTMPDGELKIAQTDFTYVTE
jgi:hypothetical protein